MMSEGLGGEARPRTRFRGTLGRAGHCAGKRARLGALYESRRGLGGCEPEPVHDSTCAEGPWFSNTPRHHLLMCLGTQ